MKKHTMFLLWLGAAISISEIYTGGLLAPLGYAGGIAVILGGHLVGTGLLALGSWISFSRKENAMDSVRFSLGKWGGILAALCNVIQLMGWTVVMVVQAGSVIIGVFPDLPFWVLALILSALVLLWALIPGSPAGRLNEIAVVLLSCLCVFLFVRSAGKSGGGPVLSEAMSVSLGIELSIAMPVSWLPLAGDYGGKAGSPVSAGLMPFAGYFVGSVLMYSFGLFIGVSTGGDIFSFVAGSPFRFAACAVVVLSTLTTAFLDLYSAAVSSRQLFKPKNERLSLLVIGFFTVLASVFFPAEKYGAFLENFLVAIGTVFVPLYSSLFIDYFLKRGRCVKAVNFPALGTVIIGMVCYRLFTRYGIWVPTLLTMAVVGVLYIPLSLWLNSGTGVKEGPVA